MKCAMQFRWLRIFLVIPLMAAPVLAADKKPADGVEDHVKEELGVNEFTTPGIELISSQARLRWASRRPPGRISSVIDW